MDLGLAGRTVMVTGGAKGIGAAVVRGLVAEGAGAIIVDKDPDAGRALCEELREAGQACTLVVADLADPAACRGAAEEAEAAAGPLHALVNNAGVNDGVGLEDGDADAFMASLHRNLVHYYEMTRCTLGALRAARGSVVNVASKVALTGQGGTSGYAASKGAVLALTREWAVDLLEDGIRVNAVVPAEVMTPLYRQWLDTFPDPEAKLESIVTRIPLGKRMTTAEEIAAAVLFLLSAQAGHITGQHLVVDGGYVHLDRALP
jgi:L-fucose dehydrogenase